MSVRLPAADRADADLASSLRISVMRLARRLRAERVSTDLSLNQLAVLGSLQRHGELTVGELASIERVKPPSMTRTVNCLVDAGLVSRRAHATDGRQVVVDLTPEARTVLEADRRRRDAWLAQRLAALDPETRELMRQIAPVLDAIAGS
ncbi:MAG: MarR family transcriptional regulator [Acidimicrobiia bacterium]